MRSIIFSLVLAILAMPAAANAKKQDMAGVLSVETSVESIYKGRKEALAPKKDVPIKSVVKSDATGRAQLIFPDDATITIGPATEVSLAEYVDAPEKENIYLNMAIGTMRVITGEASRRNPSAFTVETPHAVIGIRGTVITIMVSDKLTRVYLSETSGKGVSVRNKCNGKMTEMRSPGIIITVGPHDFIDRKITMAEASEINAQLRSRPAARQAVAVRNVTPNRFEPQGDLPFTGALDERQADEVNRNHDIRNATVVALAQPGPYGNAATATTPVSPATNTGTTVQPGQVVVPGQSTTTPPNVPNHVATAPVFPDRPANTNPTHTATGPTHPVSTNPSFTVTTRPGTPVTATPVVPNHPSVLPTQPSTPGTTNLPTHSATRPNRPVTTNPANPVTTNPVVPNHPSVSPTQPSTPGTANPGTNGSVAVIPSGPVPDKPGTPIINPVPDPETPVAPEAPDAPENPRDPDPEPSGGHVGSGFIIGDEGSYVSGNQGGTTGNQGENTGSGGSGSFVIDMKGETGTITIGDIAINELFKARQMMPETNLAIDSYKVTMPELSGTFAGNGTFSYFYPGNPGQTYGNPQQGSISFNVPQNYISLDNDVYTIQLNNIKVSGYEKGNFVQVPVNGHNLSVIVDRNTGALANLPGVAVDPGKALNHVVDMQGAFDSNSAGRLNSVGIRGGTDATGKALQGKNNGAINITKR